jgi:hypothetical protein
MARYYVNTNAQNNGDHEVHLWDGCPTPADVGHRFDLGEHRTCISAVAAAKRKFPRANGCANCSPGCHTS